MNNVFIKIEYLPSIKIHILIISISNYCVGCHHEINKIIMIVSNQGYDAKNEQYIYYF